MPEDPRAYPDPIKPDAHCNAPQPSQDGPQGRATGFAATHAAERAEWPSAGSTEARSDAARASQCDGKVGFDSAVTAHKAARRFRQGEYRLEAYRCCICGKWHLGGPVPKALRRGRVEKPHFRRPRNRNGLRQAWGQA